MQQSPTFESIHLLAFDYDGVFTDGTILITDDGHMLRSAHARDGFAVQWARKQGVQIAIITGGKEESVGSRMRGLGVDEVHLHSHDKIKVLQDICSRLKIGLEEVAYMGDDMPDLPALNAVGLACCPQDAAPEIRSVCDYISPLPGGKGCVRDLIEGFMKSRGIWTAPGQENW